MKESTFSTRLQTKPGFLLVTTAALITFGIFVVTRFAQANVGKTEVTAGPFVSSNGSTVSALATTAIFNDINPDNEGPLAGQPGLNLDPCPEPCASQHNGGRVNGLAVIAGIPGFSPNTYFAASEVGGLFKSVNGGGSWTHLDAHIPNLTWDIAARSGQRVFATSFYDGRTQPLTGLQMSVDGGVTWVRPNLPTPSGCDTRRSDQPSGFGIGLRPGSSEVFVGTNCGLAQSPDDGASWTRFDPTPDDGVANSIWDVVALPGGRTYACGDDGLLMSQSGAPGSKWNVLGKPAATLGGFCSLAVSPDEPTVVYVVFAGAYFADIAVALSFDPAFPDVDFYEGRINENNPTPQISWTKFPYPDDKAGDGVKKVRMPFVATNDRTAGFDPNDPSDGFDLWVGDGSLWRIPCHTGQTPRCTTDKTKWLGSYTDHLGTSQDAHGDSGDLVFDPQAGLNACPTLYSSDGGVFSNALTTSPACQTPTFRGANVGLHAFYLRGMTGFSRAGEASEDLYMAHQDSGLFSTTNGGAQTPSWTHGIGGDVFDVVADDVKTVTQSFGIQAGDPGFTSMQVKIPGFDSKTGEGIGSQPLWDSEAIVQVGPGRYLLTVYNTFQLKGQTIPTGVRDITNIDTTPTGVAFGGVAWPAGADRPCHIRAATGPSGVVPYVLAGKCWYGTADIPFGVSSGAFDQLWTFQGGEWVQRSPGPATPGGTLTPGAGFSILAVDPTDPLHIYASVLGDGEPRMMRSTDGGMNWETDVALTSLMNDGFRGVLNNPGDGIRVIPQPSLIVFDPTNPNIIVAGGRQSGVFLTSDGGQTWSLLTDPHAPGTSGIPHLPQPAFAHFDHDKPGFVRIYLGTGRGIWRVDLPVTDVRITKTDSNDPAFAGESLTYTINVNNLGPSTASGVVVRDRLPEGVTYASGPAFCNEAPVRTLTCTIGTLASAAQTSFNVTVNVAPNIVYLNGGPKTLTNTANVFVDQLDLDRSNNSASQSTLIKAKADAAIVSFGPANAPADVVIGESVNLTLRKVITNHGPSAPVDVVVTRSATAPAGSTITPGTSSETALAVAKDELRIVEENFSITCGVAGSQTFTFTNAIQLASDDDIDPQSANNSTVAMITVQCVVPVAINIRPKGFPNALNLNSQATLAVLTTSAGEYGLPLAFDATKIDGASVLFGLSTLVFSETGGTTEVHGTGHIEYSYELDEKTRDGDLDMVLHFPVANSGLTLMSTRACVKGSFIGADGNIYKFFGCDSVKMSP
jgi:uncharacterized repeat protein (TIGR01451 family)